MAAQGGGPTLKEKNGVFIRDNKKGSQIWFCFLNNGKEFFSTVAHFHNGHAGIPPLNEVGLGFIEDIFRESGAGGIDERCQGRVRGRGERRAKGGWRGRGDWEEERRGEASVGFFEGGGWYFRGRRKESRLFRVLSFFSKFSSSILKILSTPKNYGLKLWA